MISSRASLSARLSLQAATVLLLAGCQPSEPPPPRAAAVPVTAETVMPGPFRGSLTLIATSEPSATVELKAPASGRLRLAAPDALASGRTVRAGEPLFAVKSPGLELAVREAELAARGARSELERARRGVEGGFLADAEQARREIEHELAEERLAGAREELARLRIVAPSAGVMRSEKRWTEGAQIAAETPLAELALGGDPRARGWATASDLDRLEAGAAVVCLDSRGERVLGRGSLTEIDRRLDAGGVAQVVARIDRENERMPAAGSGILLRVLMESKESAISVPERSLLIDGSLSSVFVLEPAGADSAVARSRLVQPGDRHDGRIEILDGLAEGERVVVEGADLLADGLRVQDVSGAEGAP
ncbi:MAG: efflux RND transporter periplasmic adaptor subunit [Acidobacteriota bacterium]